MKYVRTKDDTIYQVYDKVFEHKEDKRYQLVDSRFEISLNDIVKEANTIEELCDEFVLYYLPLEEMSNNESWIPYAQYERLGVWQKMRDEIVDKTLKSKSTLYGAVWTKKGLIYIAKLNNQGELELL